MKIEITMDELKQKIADSEAELAGLKAKRAALEDSGAWDPFTEIRETFPAGDIRNGRMSLKHPEQRQLMDAIGVVESRIVGMKQELRRRLAEQLVI